jgi:hypothetical protein
MEHRRRTLSSFDDNTSVEIIKHRSDSIDEYAEYVYCGPFNMVASVWRGVVNLICPCFYKKSEPIIVDS